MASALHTILAFIIAILFLIVATFSLGSVSSTSTSSSPSEASITSSSAISSIWTAFYWSTFRSRNIRGLISFLSNDYVKLNNLSVTNRSNCLLGIVLDDGCLMNKNIFLGVIPVDETVPTLDVKPLKSVERLSGLTSRVGTVSSTGMTPRKMFLFIRQPSSRTIPRRQLDLLVTERLLSLT